MTFSPVQFSHSVVSDSLRPHESQHARTPCPSPTPGVHPNSCPSSRWCHPPISSSVVPFSSCLQSLLASESFPMSQLFAWGGLSIGVSALASVLPKNTQDWSPLEWTGWISLQSKGKTKVLLTPWNRVSQPGPCWLSLLWEALRCGHRRVFSSIPGLYPQDASSTPAPRCDDQTYLQTLPKVSREQGWGVGVGGRIALGENSFPKAFWQPSEVDI